jgi:hypothetical protein
VLLFAACSHPLPTPSRPTAIRSDVTLLGVALALRTGSSDTALADDAAKQVMTGDTVWAFPIVKLLIGGKETLYLANTLHLGRVGRAYDADSGWNMKGHASIWNRLKDDISIEWYEVRPVRSCFDRNEPLQYRPVSLVAKRRDEPAEDWYRELTGKAGFTRLLVRARYGLQSAVSGNLAFEHDIGELPWVSFRQDTTWLGSLTGMLGPVPYREGSTREQTSGYVCCDSRSLVAAGLARIGYDIKSEDGDRALDTLGDTIFSGYVRFGRLYDRKGRRTGFRDVRPGDVIHFSTLESYAVALQRPPPRGFAYGGIPAGLRLIRAAHGSPEITTLSTALWSFKTLFGRSYFTVLRFKPQSKPQSIVSKQKATGRRQPAPLNRRPAAKSKLPTHNLKSKSKPER